MNQLINEIPIVFMISFCFTQMFMNALLDSPIMAMSMTQIVFDMAGDPYGIWGQKHDIKSQKYCKTLPLNFIL